MSSGARARVVATAMGGGVALLALGLLGLPVWGQEQNPPAPPPETTAQETPALPAQPGQSTESIMQYVEALPESEAVTFSFHNRPITTLRASILGRSPADRAASATRRLNDLIADGGTHTLDQVPVETGMLIRLDGESVVAIAPQDLDPLSSNTVASEADEVVARLRVAVAEAVESRTPARLVASAARTGVATLIFVAIAALLFKIRHRVETPLVEAATGRLTDGGGMAARVLWAEMRLERLARRAVLAILAVVMAIASYLWLVYSLEQFPYTRPWGETLGETLLATVFWVAGGVADAIPGIFTILVIVVLTRLITRLVRVFFDAVQDERIRIRQLDPDAARPTRQIVVAILWIFAIVVSYPYLPGSNTDAFKGISVFVGVVLSIGSTGIVNQAMSGLILMYSSALKAGEYVKVGDVEGTVMRLGMLSTRIRTLHRELITVPNSVMIARETTNYSRLANKGVAIKTSVTLGYDIPWRQVQAVLKLAAERTNGIRKEPAPIVLQTALTDFYVAYMLIAYVDDPRSRPRQLSELHTHILDLCNEHGIQILSPHYEHDPDHPAVVPRERWTLPPAEPTAE